MNFNRVLFISIWCILVLFCRLAVTKSEVCSQNNTELKNAYEAYINSDFLLAKKLSKNFLDDTHGKLIYNLSQVYDKNGTGLFSGLRALAEIYEDTNIDPILRCEAGLCYARHVQIYQFREMYSEFKDVDTESIYENIISISKDSSQSAYAALYLCQSYFFQPDELFSFLENFIAGFNGSSSDKVMLHMAADVFYIDLKEDYVKSVYHLESALKLGIAEYSQKQLTLFRLGRMYERKLNNSQKAKYYYQQFLELYPNTMKTPLVRRYLDELNSQGR
jgi:tetratricopeptide (TPR) repeat protein